MSEPGELTAPETATPAEEKPKRRLWPLLAWGGIAAVVVTAGTVTALGTTGALIAGGCVAGTAAGAGVLWRLPQLRKHFAGPRRAARMRSLQTRSRRMSFGGGGRKGKLPGLAGRGKALAGKLAGKARQAGKGRLGKGRAGGGRLSHGKGRKSASGTKAAGGPVRRAGRRVMARARTLAGRRAPAARKPEARRRSRAAAALLPAAAVVAGGKRIRRWIRKRRGKDAADGQEKKDKPADAKPADAAAESPPPARKPGLPLTPDTADHPSRRSHTVSNQLEDTAESIQQGIGGFEPENVADLGMFLQQLPSVYEAMTSGLHRLADRFGDELPLHPSVIEHIRELASSAAGMHEYASEAHQIFATTHQEDLERIENPRTGEEFMDVSKQ